MHYSWHENPKEIMTQKCYDVLKNAILSAISNDKITSELGWKPSITFEEGIKLTIDWYLNNQDWIRAIENKKAGISA